MTALETYNKKMYNIVGAAMEVHSQLGNGFLEEVYQVALEEELRARNIPFESQVKLEIHYKGKPLSKYYIADLVCYGDVIVELKAVAQILPIHVSQVVNYLKATKLSFGAVINFGERSLTIKRCILGELV